VGEVEELMQRVEKEKREVVEPTKAIVQRDEEEASAQAADAKAIKDECESALAQAMPILEEALSALDTLSPNDINYVKKLSNPPAAVKLVMEAVCVILDVKPAKVRGVT
jgi:dynein heavy chain